MVNNSKTLNVKLNEWISWLAWCGVFLTLCTLIGVFLNLSSIVYLRFFDTYHPLQLVVCITMFIWAAKFLFSDQKRERIVYTLICIFIALGSLFFMMMEIY